ncbi:pentapeptide repeat-containing protein [Amycolatopsis sp. NPDC058986]|uniref:pentapeptide repeat-containing protein n=1 Tax=unclassified Amycolatopsis TaxID=2618356 RepID=UPI0036723F83
MSLIERRVPRLARWWRGRRGTWWWAIVVIVVPVAIVAGTAVTLLLSLVDAGDPKNRIELIKTGLTVGAGTGGVVALVLAGRRQWSTEHDAAERRMTELYVKAVEQLGSDKAAVRHGGLYALERVAQDNPDHRQTVVNVLCAYLRGPFTLPGEQRPRQRRGIRRPLAPAPRGGVSSTPQTGQTENPTVAELDDEARQEREVRLTAQRIIAAHLKPGKDSDHPVDTFWANLDLDLTGATLIDFNLDDTHLRTGTFANTVFIGETWFFAVNFQEQADFTDASFVGDAEFIGARFAGYAWFNGTSFAEEAWFSNARFTQDTQFRKARFTGDARFNGASFAGYTTFSDASFTKHADFNESSFTKHAAFLGTSFAGRAQFIEASFNAGVQFNGATFSGASFKGASFNGDNSARETGFSTDASFIGVSFTSWTSFARASFAMDARFSKASFTKDTQFTDVTFVRKPDLSDAVFELGMPESLRAHVAEADDPDRAGAG